MFLHLVQLTKIHANSLHPKQYSIYIYLAQLVQYHRVYMQSEQTGSLQL